MIPSAEQARPSDPVSQTTLRDLRNLLRSKGAILDLGAFSIRIRSDLDEAALLLRTLYPHFLLQDGDCFFDASVNLTASSGLASLRRAQARIEIEGVDPYGPFPRDLIFPHFEWAVNWAFVGAMNAHFLLHAGAVEVSGKGILLIAKPGSGKSTLTAGLVGRGARLLSDEFGVIRVDDGMLLPIAKPVALKNQAIRTVQEWWPDARIGPVFRNTRKGDLAHLAVPASSASEVSVAATPRLVIFPKWSQGAQPTLLPVAPARAFMELAANSFNYETLGLVGFEAVARIVETCACYRFEYGTLADAVNAIAHLCNDGADPTLPEGLRG